MGKLLCQLTGLWALPRRLQGGTGRKGAWVGQQGLSGGRGVGHHVVNMDMLVEPLLVCNVITESYSPVQRNCVRRQDGICLPV